MVLSAAHMESCVGLAVMHVKQQCAPGKFVVCVSQTYEEKDNRVSEVKGLTLGQLIFNQPKLDNESKKRLALLSKNTTLWPVHNTIQDIKSYWGADTPIQVIHAYQQLACWCDIPKKRLAYHAAESAKTTQVLLDALKQWQEDYEALERARAKQPFVLPAAPDTTNLPQSIERHEMTLWEAQRERQYQNYLAERFEQIDPTPLSLLHQQERIANYRYNTEEDANFEACSFTVTLSATELCNILSALLYIQAVHRHELQLL